MRRNILGIFILLGLALWAAPAGAEKWYKSYEDAQEEAKRGNWTTVVELLHAAIDEEKDPAARKRTYGMHFIEYYPYLRLGQAYLEIGKTAEAREACEQAQAFGEAPQDEVATCLRLAAAPTPAPSTTPTPSAELSPTPSPTPQSPVSSEEPDVEAQLKDLLLKKQIDVKTYSCALKLLKNPEQHEVFIILFNGFLAGDLELEEFQDLISLECSKLE